MGLYHTVNYFNSPYAAWAERICFKHWHAFGFFVYLCAVGAVFCADSISDTGSKHLRNDLLNKRCQAELS